jgi:putative tryptophan/tyrosine transport system substrate-binding protein
LFNPEGRVLVLALKQAQAAAV